MTSVQHRRVYIPTLHTSTNILVSQPPSTLPGVPYLLQNLAHTVQDGMQQNTATQQLMHVQRGPQDVAEQPLFLKNRVRHRRLRLA